jgi:hypothetical protein
MNIMIKKKCLAIFLGTCLLLTAQTSVFAGKLKPGEGVNLPKPTSDLTRAGRLFGSGINVAVGTTVGVVNDAVAGAVAGGITGAVTTKTFQGIASGAVVGAIGGTVKAIVPSYKAAREKDKYPT